MRPNMNDQRTRVLDVLNTYADWDAIDYKDSGLEDLITQNPGEFGKEFTNFLNHVPVNMNKQGILTLKRNSKSIKYLTKDYWVEPTDGTVGSLKYVDISKIRLITTLRPTETSIKSSIAIKRLFAANYMLLDVYVFDMLLKNMQNIPECWKDKVNGKRAQIIFDGTCLQESGARLNTPTYSIYLSWIDGGGWYWHVIGRDSERGPESLSAVLVG